MFNSDQDEEDEEINEIILEVSELYKEIVSKDRSELEKSSGVYMRDYKKILNRLVDCESDMLSGIPDFLNDLVEELEAENVSTPGVIYITSKSKTITIVERGLRKILRAYKVGIPEKTNKQNSEGNLQGKVIISPSFSQSQNIHLSLQQKTQIENLKKSFEEEVNKKNPNKLTLKNFLSVIINMIVKN